ncbi:MAG: HNH endonuclease [Phycisphaerales bacterium]
MGQTEQKPCGGRSHEPQDTGHESRTTTCSDCIYARRPTDRWLRVILSRWPGLRICTNHPDAPGDILGVPACSRCPNFRPRPLPIERPDVPNPVGPLVCTIPLTRKKVAMVDPQDYERVSACKWCASRTGNQWYAQRRVHGKTLRMHQFIMNPPKGMVVDHANGNGLDNRRTNLRVCTKLQNAWNKKRRKQEGAGSRFIGVYPCQRPPGKWCIKVQCNGEVTNLSPFDTDVEAARARDRKALELFGEYAMLNFPEEREHRLREIEAEKHRTDGRGQTA